MCVGNIGFNTCHGDSGGALMKKSFLSNTNQFYWQLIGIASKTIDCGFNSTSPDIFINIQYYYQWIIQTIKRSQI
jgi:secreted trypsin-like serine protease